MADVTITATVGPFTVDEAGSNSAALDDWLEMVDARLGVELNDTELNGVARLAGAYTADKVVDIDITGQQVTASSVMTLVGLASSYASSALAGGPVGVLAVAIDNALQAEWDASDLSAVGEAEFKLTASFTRP